jgi:hypothetical protein
MMKGRRGGCRVDVLIVWTAVHVDVAKISGAGMARRSGQKPSARSLEALYRGLEARERGLQARERGLEARERGSG